MDDDSYFHLLIPQNLASLTYKTSLISPLLLRLSVLHEQTLIRCWQLIWVKLRYSEAFIDRQKSRGDLVLDFHKHGCQCQTLTNVVALQSTDPIWWSQAGPCRRRFISSSLLRKFCFKLLHQHNIAALIALFLHSGRKWRHAVKIIYAVSAVLQQLQCQPQFKLTS